MTQALIRDHITTEGEVRASHSFEDNPMNGFHTNPSSTRPCPVHHAMW